MPNPGTELSSLDFGNLIGGPLNATIDAQASAARSTADFIKTVGFDENNEPIYVEFKYPKEISPFRPAINPKVVKAEISTKGTGYAPDQECNVTFSASTGEIAATGKIKANTNGEINIGNLVTITFDGDYPTSTSVTATVEGPADGGTTALINTVQLSALVPAQQAVFQDMKFEVPILTMLPIPFIKIDLVDINFNAKINSMEMQSQNSDFSASGNLELRQRWGTGSAKLNVSCAYKKSTATSSSIERTYSMNIHVQASQDEQPAGIEKLLNILEGAMISTPGELRQGN
ncbi:MAG: DUF2589 domain-containing protein [Chitinophagaceae bacterium]